MMRHSSGLWVSERISRREALRCGAGIGLASVAVVGVSAGILSGCGRVGDGSALADDPPQQYVTLYDTNAVALYYDGSLGPTTGVIKVDFILQNQDVEKVFWHGHGGVNHRYTLKPEHYAKLKRLERVYIETNSVADHTHRLFIDPVDARWRVPGAQPVRVPV